MPRQFIRRVARMPAVWRLRLLQQLAAWGVREETFLIILAVLIGFASAGAAWLFEHLLDLIRIYYYQRLALACDFNASLIFFLPLLPAVGGLIVSLIRFAFGRGHSKLHGLSAVLLSLISTGGRLPPTEGLETLLASTTTIGTGGSAGPEAPIAIIGSSVGSLVGDLAGISRRNLPALVGCGAAGGIAAVFDAPIAGVLFATEVMLRDFSVRTFTPIVISAVIATTSFHAIHHPLLPVADGATRGIFQMPIRENLYHFSFAEMPWYIGLGILCGLLSVLFTTLMTGTGKLFDRLTFLRPAFRPAIGAALSGFCGVLLVLAFRQHPLVGPPFASSAYVPIFAGGYDTIKTVIDPGAYAIGGPLPANFLQLSLSFLIAACLLKVLATSLTLGSGGSGGVFAPSIFIGSLGGGAYGVLVHLFSPDAHPSAYALVGMGAVLAAAIQAPLMSIILLFELSREYAVMLPAMLAAVSATVIHQLLIGEGLYTLPLKAQGVHVGSAVGAAVLRRISVDQLAIQPAPVVRRSQETGAADFVVLDARHGYLGLLTLSDLKPILLEPESAPLLVVGEVARTDIPPLYAHESAERALALFTRHEVSHLAVLDPRAPTPLQGLLSRATLMRRYQEELTR